MATRTICGPVRSPPQQQMAPGSVALVPPTRCTGLSRQCGVPVSAIGPSPRKRPAAREQPLLDRMQTTTERACAADRPTGSEKVNRLLQISVDTATKQARLPNLEENQFFIAQPTLRASKLGNCDLT